MLDDSSQAAIRAILQQELAAVQRNILEETRKELNSIRGALVGTSLIRSSVAAKEFVPFVLPQEQDPPPEVDGSDHSVDSLGDENREQNDHCDLKSNVSCTSTARRTPNKAVVQDISKVIDDHLTKSRSRPAKTQLQKLVRSQGFEIFFALVVVINAVIVGIRADAGPNDHSTGLDVIELLIGLLFVVELGLRFAASGWSYFKRCAGVWNILDALLVLFMLADAVCALMGVFMFGLDDGGLMRLYRVLRLVRVARMARLFHLVPELHFTLSLMLQSLSSFFWAAMLMMLIMYLVALYFTIATCCHDWGHCQAEVTLSSSKVSGQFVDGAADATQLRAYWGSTGSSMNSLFLAVFGGEDWHNMLLVFGHDTSWYVINSLVLSLFVGFVLVVILNLVNGVLVEGAQEMISDQKRDELVRMAADIFVHSGKKAGDELSREEFDELLQSEAMTRYLDAIGIELDEADSLFAFLDRDDSGSLSIVEFIQGCLRLRGPAKALDLAAMHLWLKERNSQLQLRCGTFQQQLDAISEVLKLPLGFLIPSRTQSPMSTISPLPPVEEDLPPDIVPRPSPDLSILMFSLQSSTV
ncbi:unnamed protein product [Durusdinium trenchii]|uniref:EF-hand domain-containing protein n=1 Tax=Durusdinium trenchii TaxID=1381693 RepID=A0ABP0PTH4_9DINO